MTEKEKGEKSEAKLDEILELINRHRALKNPTEDEYYQSLGKTTFLVQRAGNELARICIGKR